MSDLRLEVVVLERISRTPAYAAASVAYYGMLDEQKLDQASPALFTPDSKAVVARVPHGIVGVLTFDVTEPECARIGLAHVLPDFRGRGIFHHMYDELIKWCERSGIRCVDCAVPIRDRRFGQVLVNRGFAVAEQTYRIEL